MVTDAKTAEQPRIPLSRDRVFRGAIELADDQGIKALTMRRLAEELGVEAMSLYYHVANKEALLDGVADAIVIEIEEAAGGFDVPEDGSVWKQTMRSRILTARDVMLRHPWAPGVFETRASISPNMLKYFDALLGIFRSGDFSYDLAHHAMHVLGSRALGFSPELFQPDDPGQAEADSDEMLEAMAEQLPYMVAMLVEVAHDDPDSNLGWCDDQKEFEFGLDLILDGLERHAQEEG